MCGRLFETYLAEDLYEHYGTPAGEDILGTLPPVYNLCPTMLSPVLVQADGKRRFVRMRWQLVPSTEPIFATKLSTINARSEGVFTSRLYRDLIFRKRCIVPVSGFFEWKRHGERKRPFKIVLRDVPIMSLAGMWDTWRPGTSEEQHSFTIVTTKANELMAEIHDRMPVILGRSEQEEWLDPDTNSRERLGPLMEPCPSSWLSAVEVSSLVNSSKNNTPDVLEPAGPAQEGATGGNRRLFE
jgi:putative SOS response-associated peptidase YedK